MPTRPRVALVTDSTATIDPGTAEERGITVVPLQVVIGAVSHDEGVEGGVTPQMLAEALKDFLPVSTSRPNPDEMLEVYERLASEGFDEIVSVHLSGELSGTFESALLAARRCPVQVHALDSRQVGMGTGFAVLAAADALAQGASGEEAVRVARQRAARTESLFYVDTLEYLRRGGRVGAAAALLGSALAVKPILEVDGGRIVAKERVRTAAKALSRLADLAVVAAGESEVDVAVAHLASPERAQQLQEKLESSLSENLGGREVHLGEIGAVLGAHVGPGMVAVSVSRR